MVKRQFTEEQACLLKGFAQARMMEHSANLWEYCHLCHCWLPMLCAPVPLAWDAWDKGWVWVLAGRASRCPHMSFLPHILLPPRRNPAG